MNDEMDKPSQVRRTSSREISARLLRERIIMLDDGINSDLASDVITKLLFLEEKDPSRDISIYINSPGGYVSSGMAILDTMNHVKPDISTLCIGGAYSMACILLAAGTKGKRSALPHSTVMIHQVQGGAGGTAADVEITANEILRLNKVNNHILSDVTGKDLEYIEQKTDRDNYMTPKEAIEFGLIDRVIVPRKGSSKRGAGFV